MSYVPGKLLWALLLAVGLQGCTTQFARRDEAPILNRAPDSEADVGDPDADAVPVEEGATVERRSYLRWPRNRDGSRDIEVPDSPLASAPDAPPPVYGEEIDGAEPVIIIASHNVKGLGKNKARRPAAPAGALPVGATTVGGFLKALHLGMKPDVLALQEVVGGLEELAIDLPARSPGGAATSVELKTTECIRILQANLYEHLRLAEATAQPTRKLTNYYEYCPIFYNPMRVDCQKGGVESVRRPRGISFTFCRFLDPDGVVDDGREFDFVVACVHAPPPGMTDKVRKSYQEGLVDAIEKIRKALKKQDIDEPDLIIAGDFNIDYREAADDKDVARITSPLRRYEAEQIKNLKPKTAPNPLPSSSIPFTNGMVGGEKRGTNIGDQAEVYDDIIYFYPTYEDALGTKYINAEFDRSFRMNDGTMNRAMQNHFSDHQPIFAPFHAGRDDSD